MHIYQYGKPLNIDGKISSSNAACSAHIVEFFVVFFTYILIAEVIVTPIKVILFTVLLSVSFTLKVDAFGLVSLFCV